MHVGVEAGVVFFIFLVLYLTGKDKIASHCLSFPNSILKTKLLETLCMNPEIQAQGPVYLVLALYSRPLRKSPKLKRPSLKSWAGYRLKQNLIVIGHVTALQRASFLFSFSPPETPFLSEDDQVLGR